MNWALIIFDCDGVLVDSERLSNRILSEMLTDLGLPMTPREAMRAFVGRSMSSCVEIIESRLGSKLPVDFVEEYDRRSFVRFERELRPVPGVFEALDSIRAPVCVASSASHEKMRKTLAVTGLLDRFRDRMFSATEVSNGKPDPELFLHAAERMGAKAQACAVVEDTVVGCQAGVAAGMSVFGLVGTLRAEELGTTGAHVFDDMRALAGLLQRHGPVVES
jgi:HAD superfamily hydrolase (TIGR01509 family)